MQDRWDRPIVAFATFQALDAVACATLPLIRADLERLNCPEPIRQALPYLKATSAVGLLAGRRQPRVGRLTGAALSAYFACAIGFHVRAKDPLWRMAPAASLLVLSAAVAARGYDGGPATQIVADDAVADWTTTDASRSDRADTTS